MSVMQTSVTKTDSFTWSFDAWEGDLVRRAVLPLDSSSPITIKRDVRSFVVSASAREFAAAFAGSMADPDRAFGLVRVMRPRAELGKPFAVGQRFQGRFSVRELIRQRSGNDEWVSRMAGWSQQNGIARMVSGAVRSMEDAFTSDFGELTELDVTHFPARVKYVYLEGSYIAGSSAFEVTELGPERCRVDQTWLSQELRTPSVLWVGTSVLRMHLQVVWSQIEQAAESVGAAIVDSDVPPEYRVIA